MFSYYVTDIRWEDWARTKLDRPIPARLNPHDTLGKTLTEASDSFGSETEYGELKTSDHLDLQSHTKNSNTL